jgi:hypothetical protein
MHKRIFLMSHLTAGKSKTDFKTLPERVGEERFLTIWNEQSTYLCVISSVQGDFGKKEHIRGLMFTLNDHLDRERERESFIVAHVSREQGRIH